MLPEKKPLPKLPEELGKYFWDVKFEDLSLKDHPRFITERILNYGELREVRWLLSVLNKDYIRSLLQSSRNLNSKTKNFWEIILTDVR